MREMTQRGPWPTELEELIASITYKAAWRFSLVEEERDEGLCAGLSLHIGVQGVDSYHPEKPRGVTHVFIVPAATYDRRSWRSWVFARIADVDTHERCEFFQVAGERPYAPNHGRGRDPYVVHEIGELEDTQVRPGDRRP